MTGYKKHFDAYCREHGLNLYLSFEMPAGYETAKGTFDASSRTVFINAEGLDKEPEYERMFYLFMNCGTHPSILNQSDLMRR